MIKKINILFLLLLACAIPAFARDFTYEGIKYNVLDETNYTCEIGNNREIEGDITIPSIVSDGTNEYTVVGIASNAFFNCPTLTSINIPESVTSIGEHAFSGCGSLNSVTYNAVTPIEAPGNTFDSDIYSNATLNMPNAALADVQATYPWYWFTKIIAKDGDTLPKKLPTPTANFANKVLTLTCEDAEASIRYTLDGTDPTSQSTLYTEPIALTQDCTVKFFAQRENFDDSDIASFEFLMTKYQVAIPSFGYDSETGMLTISCSTENAEIRYTSDGSDPTATTGTKYEAPFKIDGNATYKARAFRSDLIDSKIASLAINDQRVATPAASFANKLLTLACEDAEASIRYTTDGSTPTSESTLYTAPVSLTQDCTVKFIAQREHFNDSEVASFEFKISNYQVAKPEFTYDNASGKLSITCATENAEVRYSTDGSIPIADTGTKYEGEITLSGNFSVNARAFRSDLFDSETATLEVNDQQVPAPTASFANRVLTLSCADMQATIHYTTDGTDPTSASAVYTEPLALTQDCIVKFIATRENYNNSQIVSFQFKADNYKVATPELSYNPKESTITITCATENAEIRYTTDGNDPTATTGTKYEEPISFYGNINFNARAFRSDLFDSEVASLVISGVKVNTPTFSADYGNRVVTINQAESLPIIVTIDGTEQTLETPATINVTPSMTTISAIAVSQDEKLLDSDPANMVIVFHKAPELSYDGHAVAVSVAEDDPNKDGAEISCSLNDTPIGDETVISGFGEFSATVVSDQAFRSDPATLTVDVFNTGRLAGARNGHRLSEAFGTWGDNAEDYTYLRIVGETSGEDIKYLSNLPNLATLHLDSSIPEDAECDYALAGTRIETICSSSFPKGMLKGMIRLTTVVWGNPDAKMPDGVLSENGNPNILLWVTKKGNAPADASNIVTYDYASDGLSTDPQGDGIKGHADIISLKTGFPFNLHMPLDADRIEVTKEFSLETAIGISGGWESLVLPFTPDEISNEKAGAIVPFATWNGMPESQKPFWLYESSVHGWKEAKWLEAGVPYIISMPNNPKYADEFNLTGDVTFSASNVGLTPEGITPVTAQWIGSIEFEGAFTLVDEENILALNVNETEDGVMPGSAFVDNDLLLPFGAFVRNAGERKRIPLFGDGSGVNLPVIAEGLVVDSPLPGTLRISSSRERSVDIYTTTGAMVRNVQLSPGETISIEGLTKGIYIAGGVKVMVR